jgi:protein ImuB
MTARKWLSVEAAPTAQQQTLWFEAPPQTALFRQQLWLCLHIPLLGFYALNLHQSTQAIALTSGEGSQQRISLANQAAEKYGIRAGMKISTATSLCGVLQLQPRDQNRELHFLQQIAYWAQQFTPTVSVQAPQEILLEIAASTELFQGEQALCDAIQATLNAKNIAIELALGNTPLAARWLARAQSEYARDISASLHVKKSTAFRLAPLPLAITDIEEKTQQKLNGLGIHSIGELMRLPRDGLARRYGKTLLQTLDRANGKLADIPATLASPHQFDERLELSYECNDLNALMPVINQLINLLCLRLRQGQYGVNEIALVFHHKAPDKTTVNIGMALPSRDAAQLQRLCQSKLDAIQLPQATREVQLKADQWVSLASENDDHFKRQTQQHDIAILIEQLRARLGVESIYQLGSCHDYRAEQSSKRQQINESKILYGENDRPLYLLTPPKPIHAHQSLRLIRGPERIDGGWWSDHDVKRDYYVARTRGGAWWWVFHDRRNKQWMQHGFFA